MTQANICYPNAFYHVCSRGTNRDPIFYEHSDYDYFLKLLARAHQKFGLKVHAYCLIKNHYHLYLQTPKANLPQIMKHINESYAKFFIKKYRKGQNGRVFGKRYQRQIVQDRLYSKTLFVYVMFNHYRHNKKILPDKWLYTSYNILIGKVEKYAFLEIDLFYKTFKTIKNFYKFSENFDYGWCPDDDAVAKSILGDDDFTNRIINDHINLDNKNIQGISTMTNYIGANTIINYIHSLELEPKMQLNSLVYLLREYTNKSRKEISNLLGITINSVSKRNSSMIKMVESERDWKEILSLESIKLHQLSSE